MPSRSIIYFYYVFSFLMGAPLPLNIKALSSILIFISSFTFIVKNKSLKKHVVFRAIYFKGFIILYLVTILGSLFSYSEYNTVDLLIRQIPILLFPLLIIKTSQPNFKKILIFFVLGIMSYYLWVVMFDVYFLFFQEITHSIDLNYIRYINRQRLPNSIDGNYLGLYINFAVIICLFILEKTKSTNLFLLTTIFISPFILGKFSFLILWMIIIFYLFQRALTLNKKSKLVATILVIGFMVYFSFEMREAFQNSFASRVIIWKTCLELWQIKPFLGHGTGAVQMVIYNYLTSQGIGVPGTTTNYLDAHNIFAQQLVAYGLVGFFALIYFFYKLFYHNAKFEPIIITLILILSVGQVEHIFQRQWGVMFVAFFLPLLILNKHNGNTAFKQLLY